jgi:hypothetical protein
MNFAASLAFVGVLMLPGPFMDYRDCHSYCLDFDGLPNQGLPDRFVTGTPSATPAGTTRRSGAPSGDGDTSTQPESDAPVCGVDYWDWTCEGSEGDTQEGTTAPSCDPVDAKAPTPDMASMEWPDGRIVSETGDGPVITGMETEFRWAGPTSVTWTQTGTPGLTEDCEVVPGPTRTYTARLHSLVFEFEQGKPAQVVTTAKKVTHRYDELSPEGGYTVCAYAAWEIPGTNFSALVPAGELDHEVEEIRSTLVQ